MDVFKKDKMKDKIVPLHSTFMYDIFFKIHQLSKSSTLIYIKYFLFTIYISLSVIRCWPCASRWRPLILYRPIKSVRSLHIWPCAEIFLVKIAWTYRIIIDTWCNKIDLAKTVLEVLCRFQHLRLYLGRQSTYPVILNI